MTFHFILGEKQIRTRTLPSDSLTFVNISFANSQSSKREAFSTLTMEMHSPFSAQRVGTENISHGVFADDAMGLVTANINEVRGIKESTH
jgi:hypothetical protein